MSGFGGEDPDPSEIDMLAGLAIALDSRPGAGIDITLSVHGTIVMGRLIGLGDYYRKFGDQIARTMESIRAGEGQKWRQLCGALSRAIEQQRAEEKVIGLQTHETPAPRYLHLDEVRIMSGSTIHLVGTQSSHAGLWRIRMDSVDAFALATSAPNAPLRPGTR